LTLYADWIHVSRSIRVSDDTKQMLESLKREDETFDELLERLAQSEKPINIGTWSEEQADRAREAIERSWGSFEQ
jgi:Uncharacterized ACR, COG1753.